MSHEAERKEAGGGGSAEDMASLEDLRLGLKQTLEATGSLGQIKARIRAEVFCALDAQAGSERPPLSSANLLINELIREYLDFNRLHYTSSVFLPESGQPETPPFERAFLAGQLRVPENEHSARVPLLYTLVAMLQQGGAEGAPAAGREAAAPAAAAAAAGRKKRTKAARQRPEEATAAAVAARDDPDRQTGVYEERNPIVLSK